MSDLRQPLRWCFLRLERWLDVVFPPAWNPLYQLGALGFFYFCVVTVSGIYVYILFDTGTTEAYESVEYMTVEQWYLGGVMRSLHRYASDGMVLMMVVHILREFAMGRYRGPRWFTWFTGVPVLWMVMIAGISGYWLVWDQLAQYIALATSNWLDWLGIFGEPISRNFNAASTLDDRFFTLLTFIHVVVPLLLLLVLWIHLQRVSRPQINPTRGLAIGTFVMLLALSLLKPAVSQGPADLAQVPSELGLDWFYLATYPLMETLSEAAVWGFAAALTIILAALPWLPPLRRAAKTAVVDLSNCNGCQRCADDCPYNAITMRPRTDGLAFDLEASVDSALCTSCGICMGACPTATPFRRRSALIPGIELPQASARALREELESRAAGLTAANGVVLFGCAHGPEIDHVDLPNVIALRLPCIAALPPPFIDYVLSRGLAAGVFLTGCRKDDCYHRFGVDWMEERLAGERDPALRRRVPRDRIGRIWLAENETARLSQAVQAFQESLTSQAAGSEPVAEAERPKEEVSHHA